MGSAWLAELAKALLLTKPLPQGQGRPFTPGKDTECIHRHRCKGHCQARNAKEALKDGQQIQGVKYCAHTLTHTYTHNTHMFTYSDTHSDTTCSHTLAQYTHNTHTLIHPNAHSLTCSNILTHMPYTCAHTNAHTHTHSYKTHPCSHAQLHTHTHTTHTSRSTAGNSEPGDKRQAGWKVESRNTQMLFPALDTGGGGRSPQGRARWRKQ